MGRKKTWRAGTDKNDIEKRMVNSLYFYKLIDQTKGMFKDTDTCQYYASVYCKNCKDVYCEYCKFNKNKHFMISGKVAGKNTVDPNILKGQADIEKAAENKANPKPKPKQLGGKKTKKKTKKNKKKKTKKLQIGGANDPCTKAIKAIAEAVNTTDQKELIERNYMSIDDLFKESPEYLKKLDILRFENCVPKKRECESLYNGGFIDDKEKEVLQKINIKSTETDTTKWYQIDKEYLYDFDKYKTNQELENKLIKAIDKIKKKPSTNKDSIHLKQVEWFQDFIEKKRSLFTETLETELKNMIEKFESANKEYRKELRITRNAETAEAAKNTKDANFISECLAFDTDIEKENKLKESISFIDTEDYRYHKLLTSVMEEDEKQREKILTDINSNTNIDPTENEKFHLKAHNFKDDLKSLAWDIDDKKKIYEFIKNTNFFIFGDKIENYTIYQKSDLFKNKDKNASVFLTHLNILISRMKTSKAKIKTELSVYKQTVKKAMEQVGKDNSNCTLFVRKPMEELKNFTKCEKDFGYNWDTDAKAAEAAAKKMEEAATAAAEAKETAALEKKREKEAAALKKTQAKEKAAAAKGKGKGKGKAAKTPSDFSVVNFSSVEAPFVLNNNDDVYKNHYGTGNEEYLVPVAMNKAPPTIEEVVDAEGPGPEAEYAMASASLIPREQAAEDKKKQEAANQAETKRQAE